MLRSLKDRTLGFLGCGKLGRALLRGWLDRDVIEAARTLVTAKGSADETARTFGVVAISAAELCTRADVIVLAVKPQQLASATEGLPFNSDQLVISVVAGRPRSALGAAVSPARVVRTMPNIACRVGAGITSVLETAGREDDIELATELFGALGHVERLADEDHFHAATALTASGPAFLFVAMESLADGAVAAGLPRAIAQRLAAHTVAGSGALAARGTHPAALKDEVTSPAGTTAAGLRVLEERGLRGALIDAICATADRSRELA